MGYIYVLQLAFCVPTEILKLWRWIRCTCLKNWLWPISNKLWTTGEISNLVWRQTPPHADDLGWGGGGGCGLLVSIFFEKYDDFPNRSDWTKAFFQTCTFSLSKVSEFPKGRRMLDYGLGFIYLSHLIVILAFAHGCIHGYTHGYTHWCSRCTHGPTWLSLCFPWGWLRRPRPLQ